MPVQREKRKLSAQFFLALPNFGELGPEAFTLFYHSLLCKMCRCADRNGNSTFFFFCYLSSFHFQFWLDTGFLSPSEMPSETVSYVLDDTIAYLVHGMHISIYICVHISTL